VPPWRRESSAPVDPWVYHAGVPLTKSQINKLGEKLRAADDLDEDLLRSLQDLRAEYQQPMLDAQQVIRVALGMEPTARLKTVNTLIEKLKREKTRLSRMQDLAGIRIVDGDWRAEQDLVVKQLVQLFGRETTEVDDLRAKPSHGYRAVHVIVIVAGRPVEIQVRTKLQDLWAQTFERLADHLGRGIRYGALPTGEGRVAVEHMRDVADEVHRVEWVKEEHRRLLAGIVMLAERELTAERQTELTSRRRRLDKMDRVLLGRCDVLRKHLGDILAFLTELGLQ